MKRASPQPWLLPERLAPSESAYLNRRELVRALGLGTIGLISGCGPGDSAPAELEWSLPPHRRSARWTLDRPVTQESVAARYNNFVELGTSKSVHQAAGGIRPKPWTLQIAGECSKPLTIGFEDLLKRYVIEERVYRFRCVEGWSMAVPWSGLALHKLLTAVEPTARAQYVRFVTADEPSWYPGMSELPSAPWPYTESLTMPEAMNELTLLATGIYGHALPNQHGAPLRLVVPWKYGYKSIKSLARIELVATPPQTFWNTLQPDEYDLVANVDPARSHPRWSQATERAIPGGDRVPTLLYNGYGEWVADLYSGA